MKKIQRRATDYLTVGQLVNIPDHLSAPIVYSAETPNGRTVRQGAVCELLAGGAVAVNLDGKIWDYSNREALQFQRVY